MSSSTPPPDTLRASRRQLLQGTALALGVAAAVLVLGVLPAEYGIDPTGFGEWAGFTQLAATTDVPASGEGASPEPEPPENQSTSRTVYTYVGTFPERDVPLGAFEGYTAEGDTTMVRVPVDVANLTTFEATLSWVDDNETGRQSTEPDLFEVVVRAPDGREGRAVLGRNAPGGSGNATAFFTWQGPPERATVEAESPEVARRELAALHPVDTSAQGEWVVQITLLEAGDAAIHGAELPAAVDGAGDHGNTWNLTVAGRAYALEVTSQPGSGVRRDSISLTLGPGEELEYKLRLNEDDTVEYAWSTEDVPLYFDFHGEPAGDTTGAFTSHKKGTSVADEGSLTAPFAGSHGWYWRNEGAQAATFTLELKGRYDILGKV